MHRLLRIADVNNATYEEVLRADFEDYSDISLSTPPSLFHGRVIDEVVELTHKDELRGIMLDNARQLDRFKDTFKRVVYVNPVSISVVQFLIEVFPTTLFTIYCNNVKYDDYAVLQVPDRVQVEPRLTTNAIEKHSREVIFYIDDTVLLPLNLRFEDALNPTQRVAVQRDRYAALNPVFHSYSLPSTVDGILYPVTTYTLTPWTRQDTTTVRCLTIANENLKEVSIDTELIYKYHYTTNFLIKHFKTFILSSLFAGSIQIPPQYVNSIDCFYELYVLARMDVDDAVSIIERIAGALPSDLKEHYLVIRDAAITIDLAPITGEQRKETINLTKGDKVVSVRENATKELLWLNEIIPRVAAFLTTMNIPNQYIKKFTTDPMNIAEWMKAFTSITYDVNNNYEQLETLGDKLLKSIFNVYLIGRYPNLTSFEITNLEQAYMSHYQQQMFARLYKLDELIRIDPPEALTNKIREDVFESVIGALFNCSERIVKGLGYTLVRNVVWSLFQNIDLLKKASNVAHKTEVTQLMKSMGINVVKYHEHADDKDMTIIGISVGDYEDTYSPAEVLEEVNKGLLDKAVEYKSKTITMKVDVRGKDRKNRSDNSTIAVLGVGFGQTKKVSEVNAFTAVHRRMKVFNINHETVERLRMSKSTLINEVMPKVNEKLQHLGVDSFNFQVINATNTVAHGKVIMMIGVYPDKTKVILAKRMAKTKEDADGRKELFVEAKRALLDTFLNTDYSTVLQPNAKSAINTPTKEQKEQSTAIVKEMETKYAKDIELAKSTPLYIQYDQIPSSKKYEAGLAKQLARVFGTHHNGQVKLFFSTVLALIRVTQMIPNTPILCVYAGSSPGYNVYSLAKYFPMIKWLLVDPSTHHHPRGASVQYIKHSISRLDRLKDEQPPATIQYVNGKETKYNDALLVPWPSNLESVQAQFIIYEDMMTDRVATTIKERTSIPIVFISDCRSGETDEDIIKDMDDQFRWAKLIGATIGHFKFRLPYHTKQTKYTYPTGEIFLQPWARDSTTETRLLVDYTKEVGSRTFDLKEYENRMHWHDIFYRNWSSFDKGMEEYINGLYNTTFNTNISFRERERNLFAIN